MTYSIGRLFALAAAFSALPNSAFATPFGIDKRTCPTSTVTVTATVTPYGYEPYPPATSTCPPPPPTSSCPPPPPAPFTCSKYGYLVNDNALWQVDLATSQRSIITRSLNNNKAMNAIGYNVLDNYLYGREAGTGAIIRIAQDGSVKQVGVRPAIKDFFIGDIDGSGRYYVSGGLNAQGENSWVIIDLNPYSDRFAQVFERGTSKMPGASVAFADWSFIPSAGNFLWSLGVESGHGVLLKWNMNNKTWTKAKQFPGFPASGFGACFASNNGDLYCDQNATGRIYKINVFTQERPVLVSTGAKVSNADGARCVFNTANI